MGEGTSTLAGPAQLELGTWRIPAFRSLPRGGIEQARPPALEPRGGRSRRSKGAAGPPPPRCAGPGYT